MNQEEQKSKRLADVCTSYSAANMTYNPKNGFITPASSERRPSVIKYMVRMCLGLAYHRNGASGETAVVQGPEGYQLLRTELWKCIHNDDKSMHPERPGSPQIW